MHIEILSSQISDNIFYIIRDGKGSAALIDPVDARQAIDTVKSLGDSLVGIINTHFHGDHVAGNTAVKEAFPAAVVMASKIDSQAIDTQMQSSVGQVEHYVEHGDVVNIGALKATILGTPGHTPGHISIMIDNHLFCGDTVFFAGAGNCTFGGDEAQLFRTFRDTIRPLNDDIRLYFGHDYAMNNLKFTLALQPDLVGAKMALKRVEESHALGEVLISSVGEEREYNLFMRYDDEVLLARIRNEHKELFEQQSALSSCEHEAVFRTLRQLRNTW